MNGTSLSASRARRESARIVTWREIPAPLELSTFHDFRERYQNKWVQNGEKLVRLGTYWLNHRDRRQYDRIIFDPSRNAPASAYNLWRGFAVEPRRGDWSLFREHIRHIVCSGDEVLFRYVFGWIAYAVQHPERRAEVAREPNCCCSV
jgi:hypothetical protein